MNAPLEKDVQHAVLQYLAAQRIYAAAVPNGSVLAGDAKARAMQSNALKRTGMRKGFPDLILIQRTDEGARVGFMEVKREGGKMSPEQTAFSDQCSDWRLPFAVVRSVDDARETLIQWVVGMTSLANAVAAAIAHGNTLSDIRPDAWALTYGVDTEEVRAEFERQLCGVTA